MSKEYPLFPKLGEAAEEEAQELIDRFKEKLKAAADEAIGELYSNIAIYIESDSWGNFRNELMDGFLNYKNRKIQAEYDFKTIRETILKNHREEILKDLNQDMIEEIKKLKAQIKENLEFYNKHNRL